MESEGEVFLEVFGEEFEVSERDIHRFLTRELGSKCFEELGFCESGLLSDDFGIFDLSAFKDRKNLVVFEPLKQKILGSYDEIHCVVEILDDFVIIGSKTEFGDCSPHVFEFFSGDRFNF